MHTLARSPVREARLNGQARLRAFTLIELLTVIAIIAILAGITFGVVKGVNERAAIGQAKAELASLSQALEAYKLQYGDYPQAGSQFDAVTAATIASGKSQYTLFNALVGKIGPKLDPVTSGKAFVDITRMSLHNTTYLPAITGNAPVANAFLDPWGRTYLYFYKVSGSPAAWKSKSYVLYSVGPDGLDATGSSSDPTSASAIQYKTVGVLNDATLALANNVDNIWANK